MKTSTREAILAALKAARDIADAAEGENRDLTADERTQVTQHLQKATELKQNADNEAALRKSLSDLSGGLGLLPENEPKAKASEFTAVKRNLSLGQQFVDSAEFKGLLGSVPNGRFGEKARVQSAPWGVKALVTGTEDDSAGALIQPQRLGLLDPFYQRPLTVRDLVAGGTTGSDAIEYVRVLTMTNNAAAVAEATSTAAIGDGTGGTTTAALGGVKPESGMTFEKDSTTVKTIAHWIPATKRSLSDAAQVRTLIDTFLLYGLEEALEDEIMAGDGTGEHFLGLSNTSGVQTQAAPGAGEDVFTVTRRARRKVRIGGRTVPTAYVMNPIDWENVELLRDDTGRFYGGGPFALGPNTLWSLPVIESEAVPQGTAWVANWKMAVLWDREQASIQVTDSHADFFIRNLVAILAEMRAAFAVLRPSAFVKVTLA